MRRGNLFDMIPVLIMTISIVIFLFVGLLFTSNIKNAFLNASGVPTVASNISTSIDDQAGWTFDFLLVMLFISLPLVSAILAYFVNIPPFFFFASMGVIMLVIILANAFSDSYTSFASSSTTTITASSRMPMTHYIMSHFVIYAFLCAAIIMFGVFIKPKRGV